MPARAELVGAAILWVALFAVALAARSWLGLWGAAGTDAAIWGLTALDVGAQAPAHAPPLFPALVWIAHGLGLPLVDAGWGIALLCATATPPATLLIARLAGASRAAATVAALAVAALPDLFTWGNQLQPDSAIALAILVLAGLLYDAEAYDRPATSYAAAALAGLLPTLREHGLPLLALTAAVLATTPRGRRALPVALALWWLGPALLGQRPGVHPLAVPWSERPGGAITALLGGGPEAAPYAMTMPPGPRRAYLDLMAQRDLPGLLYFHFARAWNLSWEGVLLGGVALALAVARRNKALLTLSLPLLAAAPALLVWSQRRHVLVIAPLAIAVIAACRPEARWLARLRVATALALGLAVARAWALAWPAVGPALQTEVPRARSFADVAGWIQAHGPEGSLLGGVFQDVGLYAPLPRHDPDGSAADWRTFVVADRSPPSSRWQRVYAGSGGLSVFRLDPDRSPRPCDEASPAPHSAFLAVAAAHAELVGASPECLGAGGAAWGPTR